MGAIRRVIIRIAEIMALLVIAYGVYVGATWGPSTLPTLLGLIGVEGEIGPQLSMAIGGAIGLLVAAFVSATFFLLVEIERHSRRTAYYFERLAARGDPPSD